MLVLNIPAEVIYYVVPEILQQIKKTLNYTKIRLVIIALVCHYIFHEVIKKMLKPDRGRGVR